jgi:hypothetical protein
VRDTDEKALDLMHSECLNSGQLSGLHTIFRKNPWHIPTLLSLAEMHFVSRANDETGQDMVERALLALDAASHPHFFDATSSGGALLAFEGEGDGVCYFHAIMRHM